MTYLVASLCSRSSVTMRTCEGVDLASCGLLSRAQLSQCGFPRLLIGNRRNRNQLAGTVCGGLR